MVKTAGKLSPEAKPRVVNLLFQAFFVYSRVAYTIFPHTFSEKWHLRQNRREGMCHFRLGYEEKQRFLIRIYIPTCKVVGLSYPTNLTIGKPLPARSLTAPLEPSVWYLALCCCSGWHIICNCTLPLLDTLAVKTKMVNQICVNSQVRRLAR